MEGDRVRGKEPCMKWKYYADESGDCASQPSCVAVVCVRDDAAENIENELNGCYSAMGIDWKKFHATDERKLRDEGKVLDLAQRIASLNCVKENKLILCLTAADLQSAGTGDIYIPLLQEATVFAINQVVASEGGLDKGAQHIAEVFVERRQSLMTKMFEVCIRERCRDKEKINVNITLLHSEKGQTVYLQTADFISNAFTRSVKRFDKGLIDLFEGVAIKINRKEQAFFMTGSAQYLNKRVKEGIRTKPRTVIEKQFVNQTLIVRDPTASSEKIISELAECTIADARSPERIERMYKNHLKDRPSGDRFHEMEKLCERAGGFLKERSGDKALTIAEVMFQLIALEEGREIDTICEEHLEKIILIISTIWLKAHNHAGNYTVADSRVERAEKIACRYKDRVEWWPSICEFYTGIAITCQNGFEFQEACKKISPIVEYFSLPQGSPFSGTADLHGRYVGSLYGAYSQTLFFLFHKQFLSSGDISSSKTYFDDGLVYSTFAEDAYDDESDKFRQKLYRAHAYLQSATLMREKASEFGAEIEKELGISLSDVGVKISERLNELDAAPSNDIYLLATLLKWHWLCGSGLSAQLDRKYREELKNFPFKHPFQQIAGYHALLSKENATTLQILGDARWGKGLVGLIAHMFLMQEKWINHNKTVPEEMIAGIAGYRDGGEKIENWIKEWRVVERLEAMRLPSYGGIGPISLLPYNYC